MTPHFQYEFLNCDRHTDLKKILSKLKASLEFKHVMHASSFKVPFHLTEMYSDEGPISTFCTEDRHSLVINLILEKLVPRDFSLFVSL